GGSLCQITRRTQLHRGAILKCALCCTSDPARQDGAGTLHKATYGCEDLNWVEPRALAHEEVKAACGGQRSSHESSHVVSRAVWHIVRGVRGARLTDTARGPRAKRGSRPSGARAAPGSGMARGDGSLPAAETVRQGDCRRDWVLRSAPTTHLPVGD